MTYIPEWQTRTELAIGREALERLAHSHVMVVGLGGVGAYVAEMLTRAGIGLLTLVDGDKVVHSNRNRQLIALQSTEGQYKTDLLEQRLLDINPSIQINKITGFLKEEGMDEVLQTQFSYVADAIDTLSPKVFLIKKTLERGYPLVSSMGSGGKFDPTQIKIVDVSKSYNCKFAHAVRKQLHRLGIRSGFKVVFSPEEVDPAAVIETEGEQNKRSAVGTISYMPAAFGIAMASVIIRDIAGL
jgi:tRNA A37 threonylcarbamoyladenosine dehydratase